MTMNNMPTYIAIVGLCLVVMGLLVALYAVYSVSVIAAFMLGGIYMVGLGLFLVLFGLNS